MGWGTDLAIYGAVLATGSTSWQVYGHRVRTRAERRERASRVVGGVMAFLWSINPETGFVGGIPADRQDEAIGHYTDTWDPLRGDLEALRVADPRLAVDAQAAATITAITDSFTASVWAMRRRGDAEQTNWDDLRAKYQAALAAAEELRRLVR